jgi:NAD(P)-dependent dehydrogenase (short-subunit alcohol dehydrogenase family)
MLLGRIDTPDDVASAALMLLSVASSYVSGVCCPSTAG